MIIADASTLTAVNTIQSLKTPQTSTANTCIVLVLNTDIK